jgi:hypothetical protein
MPQGVNSFFLVLLKRNKQKTNKACRRIGGDEDLVMRQAGG